MAVVLDLEQPPLGLEVGEHRLAAFVAVHPAVFAAVFVDRRIAVEHEDLLEVMPQPHLEIVRVVAGRGLDTARAERRVDIAVGENGDLAPDDGQDAGLADQVLVTLVVRVDRNAGIAHEGFRAGGRDNNVFVGALDIIFDIPQLARLVFIFDLGVGQRRCAVRAPVDNAAALVDQALFVEVDKHLAHGLRAALVHCEAFALPVAGRAQLFQLRDDAAAVLVFPVPNPLEELFAPEVVAGQLFVDAQAFLYLDLGRNARVVGAWHPQRRIALHPLEADQDVLERFVEGVPHVQLPGDVRGRDYDGKRLFGFVGLGVEEAVFFPEPVKRFLDRRRVVDLWKLVHVLSLLCKKGIFCGGRDKKSAPTLSMSGRKLLLSVVPPGFAVGQPPAARSCPV